LRRKRPRSNSSRALAFTTSMPETVSSSPAFMAPNWSRWLRITGPRRPM
jgi:hypothetical protein